jgi:hypothetical protein
MILGINTYVYGTMRYISYYEIPALSGNCLKRKTGQIFWDSYTYILMYNIYTLCYQYVILFFTYLLSFLSWFILPDKYWNVYICLTLPCYNFTLRFLSSWVLIIILSTVCQAYVTLTHHDKIVFIQILAEAAKVLSFVYKLRMGLAA